MSDAEHLLPKMSRRQFLGSLLALGASVALPVPLAKATDAQIDAAWAQLARQEPWYFEVGESGTIVAPGPGPSIRRDVFKLWTGGIDSPEALIEEVDACPPLWSRFQEFAEQAVEEIDSRLHEDLDDRTYRRLQRLEALFAQENEGWKAWIRHEAKRDFPGLLARVEAWLDEPIDWSEADYFPYDWGTHGEALSFFERVDDETLDALGVEIVMGDRPGSSYYAAELPGSIEATNATAHRLGLPFRFRRATE